MVAPLEHWLILRARCYVFLYAERHRSRAMSLVSGKGRAVARCAADGPFDSFPRNQVHISWKGLYIKGDTAAGVSPELCSHRAMLRSSRRVTLAADFKSRSKPNVVPRSPPLVRFVFAVGGVNEG